MRVSKHFKLGRTQPTLDFVDVDIVRDTPVFLSPSALSLLPSAWGRECVHLVKSFFATVLNEIRKGQHDQAERLLLQLREPNETHLGLSRGRSAGRALGDGSAHAVWRALSRSKAAKSGLIQDLEDTILLVHGISVDIISDITTNIIRGKLIEYTNEVSIRFGIPLREGVPSGPLWDARQKSWRSDFVKLPVTRASGKLLLIPKAIVRTHLTYDVQEYYRFFLLEFMKAAELSANTALVRLMKDGTRYVTKTDLTEKYGGTKQDIAEQTIQHPEAIAAYKRAKDKNTHWPLSHEEIAQAEGASDVDWDALLKEVVDLPTGSAAADEYEKAVEALLTALFYPYLTWPIPQHRLHAGRKRVDISYSNMGISGFFSWLSTHYSAANIFVECKNYKGDIANPELDQLSGRFSPSRGTVGFVVCRSFDDKDLFLQRTKDTAIDQRGFIIALDDQDLAALVEDRKSSETYNSFRLLRDRFGFLTS